MSKPAKILVILIFLLGIGFLFLSLKTSARIQRQEELIASLKDSVAEQSGITASLKEVAGPAKDKISSLGAENSKLSDDLKSTQDLKAKVEAEMAEVKVGKEKAENDLQEALAKVKPLEEQNLSGQKEISVLRQEREELQREREELQQELVIEKQTSAGAINELTEVKSVILANPRQWDRMVSPETVKGIQADRGEVLSIKPKGVTVVGFDGSSVVNKGDIYYVMRNDKRAGKLVIGDVYRSIVVYRQKEGKIEGDLQAGDVLVLK